MDVPGIVAKTVDDVMAVLSVIYGLDANDSTCVNVNLDIDKYQNTFSIDSCRVGIPEEYCCEGMSNEVKETWSLVADLINDSKGLVEKVWSSEQYFFFLSDNVLTNWLNLYRFQCPIPVFR